jgi:hypothetical protein
MRPNSKAKWNFGEREREMKGKAGESACKRGKVFPLGAVRAGLKYEK